MDEGGRTRQDFVQQDLAVLNPINMFVVYSFVKAVKLTDKDALERLHLSPRAAMDAANAFVAAQTFKFGFVHCDPHPGNILVRPHPRHPGQPEIVVIDHGLYIPLEEDFRKSYWSVEGVFES